MRILVLALSVLLSVSSINSETFHAIIFANTDCPGDPRNPGDQGIGPSVTGDYYRMKIEMTTISSFIDYELKTYYCTGSQDDFSKSRLDEVLDNLQCAPNDIVFFYYSGHGSRSENETTDFPQMNLVVDPYKTNLSDVAANYPIYNVMKRIESKNPRFTIVVGDLCNSVANWVNPKQIPTDKAATKVEDAPITFYKDLFLKFKGSLIATSSKPGQTSAACADGGAFTLGLMQVLQLMVTNNIEPSWDTLLEGAVVATEKITGGKQTPVYDTGNLQLSSISGLTEEDSRRDENTSDIQSDSNHIVDDETALSDMLTQIGDEQIALEKRIKLSADALSMLFDSPRAIVKVVGKDGRTVVSTKTAKAYLDWLTVTTNLYKIVPVEANINHNKKFTYLQVHEMYKQ